MMILLHPITHITATKIRRKTESLWGNHPWAAAALMFLVVFPTALAAQSEYPDAPSAVIAVKQHKLIAQQPELSGRNQETKTTPTRSELRTHKFFDRTNLLLTAAEISALVADGIISQEKLGEGWWQASYDAAGNMRLVWVPRYHERDPLARPFVNAGWPGQIAGGTLVIGADLGLRYLLHRKGHHRAERLIPFILIGYGTVCTIHGLTLD